MYVELWGVEHVQEELSCTLFVPEHDPLTHTYTHHNSLLPALTTSKLQELLKCSAEMCLTHDMHV